LEGSRAEPVDWTGKDECFTSSKKKKKKMSASERINALKTRIQRTNTACCLEAQEERRLCMLIFLYLQSLDVV
jgi:hypothetical protein